MSIKLNYKYKNVEELNQAVYTPQMTVVKESRVLKHWNKMAIIPFKMTKANKWTKYTLPELLWINIVSEMRDFGLPLTRIKDAFDTFVGDKKEQWATLVHHLIYEEPIQIDLIITQKEIYLFITGLAHVWINGELIPNANIRKPASYLQINVNTILEQILKSEELPLVSKMYITYLKRKLDNVS